MEDEKKQKPNEVLTMQEYLEKRKGKSQTIDQIWMECYYTKMKYD